MKCPLRKTMNTTVVGQITFTQDDCLKEECAWWVAGAQRCAVLVVAAHVVGLVAIGDRLLEKMPH